MPTGDDRYKIDEYSAIFWPKAELLLLRGDAALKNLVDNNVKLQDTIQAGAETRNSCSG